MVNMNSFDPAAPADSRHAVRPATDVACGRRRRAAVRVAASALLLAGAWLGGATAQSLPAVGTALSLPQASTAGGAAVVTTPQVRAELVAHAPDGVVAGKPVSLGLLIRHQPQWHTYWKNPGDSGLPTRLDWQLPAGVTAGPIEWPTPHKLPLGPLVNYGYEGELLLPVALTVPAGIDASALEVRLQAEWLVCKDVCIPEQGEFTLRRPVQAATAAHAAAFEAARAARPTTPAGARGEVRVAADALSLRVDGLPAAWRGKPVAFFPETPGVIQNAAVPAARWDGATWVAEVALDPQRSESPTSMPAVFTTPGVAAGVAVEMPVVGAWPAVAAAPPLPAVEPDAGGPAARPLPAPAEPPIGLALAIGWPSRRR
jgi:thiol:disulfide interchange protein DsbD